MNLSKLYDYGIAGIVVAILFFILFKMLVWVMSFIKETQKEHNEERKTWLEVVNNLKGSIDLHNQHSIEARRATEEAHRYQRSEHENITANLIEISKSLYKLNGK